MFYIIMDFISTARLLKSDIWNIRIHLIDLTLQDYPIYSVR